MELGDLSAGSVVDVTEAFRGVSACKEVVSVTFEADGLFYCEYSVVIDVSGCQGDFDDSGGSSVTDIFSFLTAWFAQSGSPCPAWGQPADFNGDGCVTIQDYFAFLSAWFLGCNS